jgi:DNA-binding MarR family transcriptional regulator
LRREINDRDCTMKRTAPKRSKRSRTVGEKESLALPFEERALRVLALFRQVVASAKSHFQSVQRTFGITGVQLWALWQIRAHPGLNVGSLARHMSIHQSTASNLVERLQAQGLIRRERTRPDQRVVRLFASRAGRSLLESAPDPARGVLAEALWQLSDRELLRLYSGLELLARRIGTINKQTAKRPLSELI